ncbi:RNA polymerase sigma-70 factor [Dyadobacter aurulentus]|uniref:RNA polymerase sigma-70 factor n=1 Tax=Dyadobacter sp. UC 10 TaxID=2605428 RepID=UPI0011F2C241|nr:RNA polymerase sigma-70 factor [Dyadobacter sp. UC 10]KAA0990720.1 RNA polymerase sigma-70 factor [Dyadobacter sp. UC 10]
MTKQDLLIKAIEEAFNKHYEALYRYAFTLLKENETAKDVVQKVFLSLLERTDALEIKVSLQSYLFRAVYNHCINHQSRSQNFVDLDRTSEKLNSAESGITSIEIKEMQNSIDAALNKLPPQCKIIFIKSREEGKTYSQVAAELGIAVKTVEAQMTKALKILRLELADLLFCLISIIENIN